MASTRYDVLVNYLVKDQASKGLKDIEGNAKRASSGLGGLKTALMTGVGFVGLSKAKSALLDFNNNIEQMQIGMAYVIGSNLKKPFADARKDAEGLFTAFQKTASSSAGTTEDFMNMANGIAGAVTRAGMGLDELKEITTGAVIASQSLGIQADVAARDVEEILTGRVTATSKFARALLEPMGFTDREKFNDMSNAQRAGILRKSFSSQQMKDTQKAQETSFMGTVSTLQDKIQIALGEVGKPLMMAITAEVSKWNDWLTTHPELIKQWASDFGSALAKGFNVLKDVAGFFVENRDTLFSLAKAFLFFKGTSMVVGSLGDVVGGMQKFATSVTAAGGGLQGAVAALSGSGTGFIGALGAATGALGALYFGLQAAANWIDKNQKDQIDRGAKFAPVNDWSLDLAKGKTYGRTPMQFEREILGAATGRYVDKKTGAIDQGQIFGDAGASWDKNNKPITLEDAKMWEQKGLMASGGNPGLPQEYQNARRVVATLLLAQASKDVGMGVLDSRPSWSSGMWAGIGDGSMLKPGAGGAVPAAPKDPKVNVTINKIEVASADPDRFAFGLVQSFKQVAQNPTQAGAAMRGGF